MIELHSAKWRPGSRSRDIWMSSLQTYVFPTIGAKRVDEITSADLMTCLAPIWFSKAETARRVRQRISAIMKWSVAEGHRTNDPTGTITAALGKNSARRQHLRSVPHSQVAEALATIRATNAWIGTIYCFEFLTLCAVRSGEARLATWNEIDLEFETWTIPGQRTKTGEPHRVPLSTSALAVLSEARQLSDGSSLVFPSATAQALSDSTISKLCRENGVEGTPHGMRSAFRSWAAETGADWAVAELCLGHRAGTDVELAYQRSDLLERRRELMETWAQYLNP